MAIEDDSTPEPGDEPLQAATQVASPAARRAQTPVSSGTASESFERPPPPTGSHPSAGDTTSAPADALLIEEIERTRVFGQLSLMLCLVIIPSLFFFGGDPIYRYVFIGGLAGCALQALYVVIKLRDPANYDTRWINAFAVWATITTQIGAIYIGVFSVAPTAVVVGIHFFGRSQSRAAAMVIYLLAAGMQALIAALILGGAMQDPGLFTAPALPLHVLVIIQVFVQLVFLVAFVLARSTRASSLRAIAELHAAMQQIKQREALFQEVRQDLDNALEIAGAGRYTDQQIGSYRLGGVIGRGAMAEVYEATHPTTGDRAAVKLLHPNVLERPGAAARFFREAEAAGSLRSENAVRVLESAPEGAAVPYLAMELLQGHDLAYWLRKRRRLPVAEVVELVSQVATVVDLARDRGIVHRDLKPQNLFAHEPSPGVRQWKILDFGMSTLGEHAGTLTRGAAVGTPAYMAPEQARGKPTDHRADLYSVAAIAYRCLTGRAPFSGRDIPATLYSVVYDMPPRPSAVADLPEAIDDVLAVGLAKSRTNRFESGAELIAALRVAATGQRDDWLHRRADALLLELPWGSRS